jgi:HSP20 family molecular chaperone IbpA
MVLRKRIVARPSARRPLTEPRVPLATCHWSRAAGACLLSVLLMMSPGRSISDPGATPAARSRGPAAAALAVSVSETPDAVRLRIQASGEIAPGSVEVRFAGRKAVVLARDAEGRAIRSQRVRLPAPVVEEGASADYDAEDALVMTLRKQAAAQAAAPPGDPEAAAR